MGRVNSIPMKLGPLFLLHHTLGSGIPCDISQLQDEKGNYVMKHTGTFTNWNGKVTYETYNWGDTYRIKLGGTHKFTKESLSPKGKWWKKRAQIKHRSDNDFHQVWIYRTADRLAMTK